MILNYLFTYLLDIYRVFTPFLYVRQLSTVNDNDDFPYKNFIRCFNFVFFRNKLLFIL